jgi:phosphoribosylformimino-5-aminoimidazole carboxamide ribotide isomerase
MTFEVIPALDLRGGRCVRLFQGDYDRETVYGDDPVAMALHWQEQGAGRLHVVDLEGARSGEQANAAAVMAIVNAVSVPVQLGGGVRDLETIERWLSAGVDRVFLGTAAVTDQGLAAEACRRFPGQLGAAADARDGRLVARGWEAETGENVEQFTRRMLAAGVSAVSYTNVALDGTMTGPDIEGARALIESIGAVDAQFILAGGVGTLEHVLQAAAVAGLGGVIVGRALYEGTIDLSQTLQAVAVVKGD